MTSFDAIAACSVDPVNSQRRSRSDDLEFRDETYINQLDRRFRGSKRLAKLGFEVGNAVVGGGEFAGTILHLALKGMQPMRGVTECMDLLA